MLRLTPVVRSLIIINVLVFLVQMIAPTRDFGYCLGAGFPYSHPNDVITGFLSLWNVRTDCFKPYQLFTYMFVHGGFSHIFFNMLSLAFMGPILENYWGTKQFTVFYVVTGIGAGVCNIFVDMFLARFLWAYDRCFGGDLWNPDGIWDVVSKYGNTTAYSSDSNKSQISCAGAGWVEFHAG
jgi:membrane associated rhomboid family serine protease